MRPHLLQEASVLLADPLAGHPHPKVLLLPQIALREGKRKTGTNIPTQQLVEGAGSPLCLPRGRTCPQALGTAAALFQLHSHSEITAQQPLFLLLLLPSACIAEACGVLANKP